MKKLSLKYIMLLTTVVLSVAQFSCNKALDLKPLDQISDASFWKTPNDFMLAANQFYTFERTFNDVIFDNPHCDSRADIFATQNIYSEGNNTLPVTDGTWNTDYSRLFKINYLLKKAASYPSPADIKQYVAEAKFFRAYVYFDLLELYGSVPLVISPLTPDSTQVYGPRADRNAIVNLIINDLNAAIPDLPQENALDASSQQGRVSEGAAQGFLSRVALYEGTWQEFRGNTTRGDSLLDIAISASNAVINSKQYALFGTAASSGGSNILGDSAQKYMFILENQKSNPAGLQKSANHEYILANRYDQTLRQTRTNISHTCFGLNVTRSFANLYLCKDGLPVDKSPLFQGYATMASEFRNRDNRMRYNLMIAGGYYWSGNNNWHINWDWSAPDIANANASPFRTYANSLSGYDSQKWVAERQVPDYEESYDYPVIRYAEVLLNYAEAVFERNGSISDADLDKSLNLVRLRVNGDNGMPPLTNAFVQANGLDMRTEIRRERTIELYLEGFRIDDLKRWNIAVDVLGKPLLGVQWTGTEYQAKWTAAANTAKDANGNIIVDGARSFSDKNYLLPIPTQQIQLDPKLTQNAGW